MDWSISQAEAARRVRVTNATASILIRTHKIPVESLPGRMKYCGLTARSFARFKKLAEPFARRRRERQAATLAT